jgi:hypothetical protein
LGKINLIRKVLILNKEEIPFETNIPIFDHSITPCARQKCQDSRSTINLDKLYNFRNIEFSIRPSGEIPEKARKKWR